MIKKLINIMKNKEFSTKEKIQYIVAISGLAIGIIFCGISLFTPPPGAIDNSAIYVLGLFLSFVAAIFGIDLSYSSKVQKMETELQREIIQLKKMRAEKGIKDDDQDDETKIDEEE